MAQTRGSSAGRRLLLGAHISIAGGLHKAIARGEALGCTAIQVFTRNNVRWTAKPLSEEAAERFRAAWHRSTIGPIIAHANYLVDLGKPDRRRLRLSLLTLADELRRAHRLGIQWVVLHPGTHGGLGEEKALGQIARAIGDVLAETAGLASGILLETSAGQGTAVGYRLDHLAWLLERCGSRERLGVCVDTCHLFAAGYDIRTPEAYRRTFREFDRVVGTDAIKTIHLNDSRRELGSRVDRHAHIGRGEIGLEAFGLFVRDARFADVAKFIETPKEGNSDRRNLATLRRLACR